MSKSPSIPEHDFLRMCIDCHFSRCYQASNTRNVWFICLFYKTPVHYNESCEQWAKNQTDVKKVKDWPERPPLPPKTPNPPSRIGEIDV